jgi:hypothetical protein
MKSYDDFLMGRQRKSVVLPVVILLLSLLFFLTMCARQAPAATVELGWDTNPIEDQVRRYNVCWSNYSGNSKAFAFTNCSSTTTNRKIITDISSLQKWYFRVNATNDTGTSLWSNQVYLSFVRTPSALKFQKIEIR